jgi:CheY-like chemotaxis protein
MKRVTRDGYALSQILRRDATTRAVPIIVATAESRPACLERARLAGANAVLMKPCAQETMLSEVWRLIGTTADPVRGLAYTRTMVTVPSRPSVAVLAGAAVPSRSVLSHAHPRSTTTSPAFDPPELRCPSCDGPLHYERRESHWCCSRR